MWGLDHSNMSSPASLGTLKQVAVTNCCSVFSFEWRIENYYPESYLSQDFCHPLFPDDLWFIRLDPPSSPYIQSEATVTIIPKKALIPEIAITLEWNESIIMRTMFDPSRQALSVKHKVENGYETLIGSSICLKCNLYYPNKLVPNDSAPSTLELDLKNFLSDSEKLHSTADFKLISSDGITSLLAHRLILAARSSYFRAMFCIDSQEKREGCVHLKSTPMHVLRKALPYIYEEEKVSDNLSLLDAIELLKFADQYDFLQFKVALECYMATKLTADTLPLLRQLTSHISCDILSRAVERLSIAD